MSSKTVSPEELAREWEFSVKIKEYYSEKNIKPLCYTLTFGCQQNEADTELIKGILREAGYGFTDNEEEADLYVVNTCAIREHAEMRAFGNIGQLTHLKRAKKGMISVVCGCMAQEQKVAETIKKSYPYIDIVAGTHRIHALPELIFRRLMGENRIFDASGNDDIIEGIDPVRGEGVCAWLSIMYGCNNFCSYCIVPYVRGRERSRTPEKIEEELKKLVAMGYKEITLLGQNVNSYGKDLDEDVDFSDLLERLNAVPGDFKIRFMTSHPKDATKKLFDTMAKCDKVCKAIHLPVQCGSDRVLKEMNRKYTVEKYLGLVDYARSVMPTIGITTDIIVGFPGETESEFEGTLELLSRVRYDSIFNFIYSPRPGTKAAAMPDPVSHEEKVRWFNRLVALQNSICEEINASYVGKTLDVLVDDVFDEGEYDTASRTDNFKRVYLKNARRYIGKRVKVKVERNSTWALYGSVEDG